MLIPFLVLACDLTHVDSRGVEVKCVPGRFPAMGVPGKCENLSRDLEVALDGLSIPLERLSQLAVFLWALCGGRPDGLPAPVLVHVGSVEVALIGVLPARSCMWQYVEVAQLGCPLTATIGSSWRSPLVGLSTSRMGSLSTRWVVGAIGRSAGLSFARSGSEGAPVKAAWVMCSCALG